MFNFLTKTRFTRKVIAFQLFWFVSHIVLFVYGFIKQKNDPGLKTLNALGFSVFASRGAGLALALDCALAIISVCRNLMTFLRQTWLSKVIDFDDHIFFHKQSAYSMLFFTLIHTNAHYVNFFRAQMDLKLFQTSFLHWRIVGGATGHVLLMIMFLMYTAAHQNIRKEGFETFWYMHQLFFIFYLVFFFHGYGCFVKDVENNICKPYYSWAYSLVGFSIYVMERLLRWIRANQRTHVTKVIRHACQTIEIQFEKRLLQYKPGQYLFMCIPQISRWQWHPFTISSCPEDGFVSVHIKEVGNWTRSVAEHMIVASKNNVFTLPQIQIDGPFGAPAQDFFKSEVALLVAGGIGVTPFASILKSVWHKFRRNAPMRLKRLVFFWVCRDMEAFGWFQSLLKTLEEHTNNSLDIRIYVTEKMNSSKVCNIVVNEVGAEKDAVTDLHSRTWFGRPHWCKVMEEVRESIRCGNIAVKNRDKTIVDVYYCGPVAMGQVVCDAGAKISTTEINFCFHQEHF